MNKNHITVPVSMLVISCAAYPTIFAFFGISELYSHRLFHTEGHNSKYTHIPLCFTGGAI